MKKTSIPVLATAVAMLFVNLSHASVTLTDIGTAPPTPGAYDIYMTDESDVQEVAGLNYYSNGGNGAPVCAGENPLGRSGPKQPTAARLRLENAQCLGSEARWRRRHS